LLLKIRQNEITFEKIFIMSLLTIPEGQEGVNKVGQGAAPSYFALDLSLPL
jgi:hypothetical protein